MRWECRYSSCEMMYVEVGAKEVRCYLDHSPHRATIWTLDEFIDHGTNGEIGCVFSEADVNEMLAEAKRCRDDRR
jgi:hypothetical protein